MKKSKTGELFHKMDHLLDNPAWHALLTNNSQLGSRNAQSAYFDPSVSPFAALTAPTIENLDNLHKNGPASGFVILVSNQKIEIGKPWKDVAFIEGYQMIYQGNADFEIQPGVHRALTITDVPQMLGLTKLTNPGPFATRTIEFGHYEGVFEGEKLVAMCGQRLNPGAFAEISAVCTHPDHLGKGYAQYLMKRQIKRMLAAGNTPFLHVKADNERAIRIYEHLGFAIRSQMYFCPMRY